MPFNSETYAVNKARRERDTAMQNARRARLLAFYIRTARWSNGHLRFAKRIKAISNGTPPCK